MSAKQLYDIMREAGVEESTARRAARNCAKAVSVQLLIGGATVGASTAVLFGAAFSPLAGLAAAPAGVIAGAKAFSERALNGSAQCEEVRNAARVLGNPTLDLVGPLFATGVDDLF